MVSSTRYNRNLKENRFLSNDRYFPHSFPKFSGPTSPILLYFSTNYLTIWQVSSDNGVALGLVTSATLHIARWNYRFLTDCLMMGLFAIMAQWLAVQDRRKATRRRARWPTHEVRSFTPQRLEPRRMLDASAVGMAFSALDGAGDFVQVGQLLDETPIAAQADDLSSSNLTLAANTPPSHLLVLSTNPVLENGFAHFIFIFGDPDRFDTHSIDVDWGDGSAVETFAVAPGHRFAFATHQYLDDDPTGTPVDFITVQATVKDNFGAEASGSGLQNVFNVAPFNLQIDPLGPIGENSQANLHLSFEDRGTLDTLAVEIDWGDGFFTTGPATGHTFAADHVYADNGAYTVNVRVEDDDLGVGTSSTKVVVKNEAPTLTVIGDQTLDEGQLILLPTIGTFTDPGFDNPYNLFDPSNGGETEESFTFNINWGDGSPLDAGAGVIDLPGSPGVDTAGSFGGSHLYADNGIYTVRVTLFDDDGGAAQSSFQSIVKNVDPTLAVFAPIPTVSEGQAFTLASLGVRIEDPGFDNPDNPLQAGGSVETFSALTVDWGDGTTPDVLTIGPRTNGGPFVPTTAELLHAPHIYADNGSYTVALLIADDDGGLVSRTLTIDVENVAPSLALTSDPQVVDEGSLLVIASLGTLTDPGFDNPLAPPPTLETFSYTIDWGDGVVDTGLLPVTVTTGSPGVLSTGSLGTVSHTYADNNVDALHNIIDYTVIVTLIDDDDGGATVETMQVTVGNVAPTLTLLAGTDIDRFGETILTGRFFDPGADTYVLEIDWSDGTIQHVPLSGPTPQDFSVVHRYSGPPNPLSPAADVEINVRLLDDDAGLDTGQVFVSNPGEGVHPVRIDTTPQVPRLVFLRNVTTDQFVQATSTGIERTQASDLRAAVGETKIIGDRYFELRVLGPEGAQSAGIKLKSDVLVDLPSLFRKLPDNRYAIYLVRTETNIRRLVLEFDIRNGKVIDPGDDTEGARDRPPTEETAQAVQEPELQQQPQEELPVTP